MSAIEAILVREDSRERGLCWSKRGPGGARRERERERALLESLLPASLRFVLLPAMLPPFLSARERERRERDFFSET